DVDRRRQRGGSACLALGAAFRLVWCWRTAAGVQRTEVKRRSAGDFDHRPWRGGVSQRLDEHCQAYRRISAYENYASPAQGVGRRFCEVPVVLGGRKITKSSVWSRKGTGSRARAG